MAFAFGMETHRRVISALSNLKTFRATRGADNEGLVGMQGPYRRLTNMRYGALPHPYAHGLDEAVYIVYCYGTPIAWVTMADEATEDGRVNFVPDWQYSPTTTYYQGLVYQAWGGKVVDPSPQYTASVKAEKKAAANRAARMRRAQSRADSLPDAVRVAPADYQAQDRLIDEVRGYAHPAHP